ncbi:ABC transporter ATP-binding protein [uncultured Propionibacterium sp.]|uniref:ABC transporter ATP-binding protein n=1 Tax=uncultured Propionibacterium sp. TaxID=218066 RepID=UPI00292D93EA|nr:ABC transporter ATP-binding protein [uncultured Propionibacterium sp.]
MGGLLDVRDLRIDFGRRRIEALHGIGFRIGEGARVGLIGESGSGKSVTALATMGLLPDNAHVSGSIEFDGRQLVGLSDAGFARLRGDAVSMIFQEPMTALDPTMRAGRQVAEVLRLHQGAPAGRARERVIAMLDQVGLPEPERIAMSYPHQLSGGQRQRVLIAMALINQPRLVICDEPTTALDVTVQARVLHLLDEQLSAAGAACLFISHDLAVVSQVCDEVLVMYRGDIVEAGPIAEVLAHPDHPYTAGLIATARIDQVEPGRRLPVIEDFWERTGGRP